MIFLNNQIQNGKIYVDDYNGWVPLEVKKEDRKNYRTLLFMGLIDEHGNETKQARKPLRSEMKDV